MKNYIVLLRNMFSKIIPSEFRNIMRYKKIEEKNTQLSQVVEQNANCIVITDIHGTIQYVNPKFTEITGYSAKEAVGQNPRILKSGKTSTEEYRNLWDTITSGNCWDGEFYNRKKTADYYWERVQISPIKDTNGKITNFFAVKEDITNIKRLKKERDGLREQLYHARKLEAVGRLAGGVAHEFNNMLMAIIGYASICQLELSGESPVSEHINKIIAAAERASDISKSMLMFSRKQPVNDVKLFSLNSVVKMAEKIFLRYFGENIHYFLQLPEEDKLIMAGNRCA